MNADQINAVNGLISGPHGLLVFILALALIVIAIMCVRGGLLHIKTDSIELGNHYEEIERTILRNQFQYVTAACNAFEYQIPKDETYDYDRGRLILQLMANKMTEWIMFNHIEETPIYIENRQDQIWNLVLACVEKDELRSPEFKKQTDAYVRKIIHRLVTIRKEYQKQYF